jgi:hypothetical protein
MKSCTFIFIILLICIGKMLKYSITRCRHIKDHRIFVKPQWGLGNRLRTMSGAYAAAKRLNMECVIIWTQDSHFPQHIQELYTNLKVIHNTPPDLNQLRHDGKCELYTNLDQIEKSVPCIIESCMCHVAETDTDRHLFYTFAKLSSFIMAELKLYCNNFLTQRTIGIHIRQGDIADVRDNNFFGKISDSKVNIKDANQLVCCSRKTANDKQCPSNVEPIEDKLVHVKSLDANDKIWIATDRPTCLKHFESLTNEVRYLGKFKDLPAMSGRDMRYALIDIYMLAMCTVFHGTGISSFTNEVPVIQKGIGHLFSKLKK